MASSPLPARQRPAALRAPKNVTDWSLYRRTRRHEKLLLAALTMVLAAMTLIVLFALSRIPDRAAAR